MIRWIAPVFSAALSVAQVACFSPNYGEMAFACRDDGACPSGYTCKADNRCYRTGGPDETEVDAAAIDGAPGTIDGSTVDGMVSAADASIADASPFDAAPTPDANPCSPVSLLVEGAFDGLAPAVTAAWEETPMQEGISLVWTDNSNHTPDRLVWLGGIAGVEGTDTVDQTVDVPAGTGTLTLTGFYRVGVDTPADQGEDNGGIEILDSGGSFQETLTNWTGDTPVSSWTMFSATATGDYAGQTIVLRLRGYLDGDSRHSNFFFDTLTLTADPCP